MFSKLLYLAENMTVNRILYYKYLIFLWKKEKKWEEVKKKEDSKEYYQWINNRIDQVEKKRVEEKEKSEAPVRI